MYRAAYAIAPTLTLHVRSSVSARERQRGMGGLLSKRRGGEKPKAAGYDACLTDYERRVRYDDELAGFVGLYGTGIGPDDGECVFCRRTIKTKREPHGTCGVCHMEYHEVCRQKQPYYGDGEACLVCSAVENIAQICFLHEQDRIGEKPYKYLKFK